MKLAAASCAKLASLNPQPAWDKIRAEQPNGLLLLGDTVYLEHNHHDDPAELAAELQSLYAAQFAEPNFAALLADLGARGAPLLSIYDDHDFLGNDRYGGDAAPKLREAARDVFVQTFAPNRTGNDVYRIEHLGLVDVIVLDQRFYRTRPSESRDKRDAILGTEQWNWFEKVFKESTAPYLLVASSTTFHRWKSEAWEEYPHAFQRMIQLFAGRTGAFILSGDIHMNAAYDESGIIEIVTSNVARKSLFGNRKDNFAILEFGAAGMDVSLHSLKAGDRFRFHIPLNHWTLP
jgi:alkaline phosphatase D